MQGPKEYLRHFYCSASLLMLLFLGISGVIFKNPLFLIRANSLGPIFAACVSFLLSKKVENTQARNTFRIEAAMIFIIGVLVTLQWLKAFSA